MKESYETAIALTVLGSTVLFVSVIALICNHKHKITKRCRSDYLMKKRLKRQRAANRIKNDIQSENKTGGIFVIPSPPPNNLTRPDEIIIYPEIRSTAGEDYRWESDYNNTIIPGSTFHEEYNTQPAYNPAFH